MFSERFPVLRVFEFRLELFDRQKFRFKFFQDAFEFVARAVGQRTSRLIIGTTVETGHGEGRSVDIFYDDDDEPT